MRGTRLALTRLHQHRLTSVEGEVRGQYLATAANAVDHAVERCVLAIDWIVRIHQVFLRGHLIGARLAVADRCGIRQQLLARIRRCRCGWISRTNRLRNRYRTVDQGQQRYCCDQLSHDGSPNLPPSELCDARNSMSCCQSRLLRAKRETSRAATAPTLPRQTSATIRSKPARATPPVAERPRSSSTVSMRDQPKAVSDRASHIARRRSLDCGEPDGRRTAGHTGSPCAPDGAA